MNHIDITYIFINWLRYDDDFTDNENRYKSHIYRVNISYTVLLKHGFETIRPKMEYFFKYLFSVNVILVIF